MIKQYKKMSIKVLIADDHSVVRQGLRTFLTLDPDIEVVGTASNGEEALKLAHELVPDVILMDLQMPGTDGIETTRLLTQELPAIKVLVLTSSLEQETINRALQAGAAGYLLKNLEAEALCRSIKSTASGQVLLSPQVAALFTRPQTFADHATPPVPNPNILTVREKDVLRWLAQGKTNKEIAYNLKLSEKTVKIHVSIILAKLNMQSRTQAALQAARMGLLDDPLAGTTTS